MNGIAAGGDRAYVGELSQALERRGLHFDCWRAELSALPAYARTHGEKGAYLLVGSFSLSTLCLCRSLRPATEAGLLLFLPRPRSSGAVLSLFEVGADDCIFMPCTVDELAARLRAYGRRARPVSGPGLAAVRRGSLTLYPQLRAADLAGRALELSGEEFTLLLHLAQDPYKLYTPEELNSALPAEGGRRIRSPDVLVGSLVKKLGPDAPCIGRYRGSYYFLPPADGEGRTRGELFSAPGPDNGAFPAPRT